MEYLAFAVVIAILILCFYVKGLYDDRKQKKKFIYELYHNYGDIPVKEYNPEQFTSISRYFKTHPKEEQIDDITWNDLGMDDVFKRMNITYCSAGEEYLYYTLRTPMHDKVDMQHFDEIAEFFQMQADERVALQLILAELGRTGKFSLYDYLENLDILGKRSNLKNHFFNALFIPCIMLIAYSASYGILCTALLSIWNMISYFKEKNEIDTYITSFNYVMRLIQAADKIGRKNWDVCKTEIHLMREHKKGLEQFRRGSFWLMSTGRMSGSSNPLDMIMDYLRMLFHLDLLKFNQMLAQVKKHKTDIDILMRITGYLETAIAVGAYRKSIEGEWCKPVFVEENILHITDAFHPLLKNPVKNSITTRQNVLLTGSNASGKSTFLKTIAINAVLAQSIYTCLASDYSANMYAVCSSMSLKDDISGGDSYYMVEIKAMKRILDMAQNGRYHVLCFVDEVLRGTNTVERIAAANQILRFLAGRHVTCFAATHDIELTDLLEDVYDNYHFKEEIAEGDVRFDYKLLDGKASTRNAIKLLSVMGYDDTIIEKANRQAEHFVSAGVWIKTK